jgi:hypothetical protein
MGEERQTVKKCPPFIDAMTYGFLIPLVTDVTVRDGEFTWDFEVPSTYRNDSWQSPIGFHDPSQALGTPFGDEDEFIVKFNNFWTIQAPPGYSLLFTHPVNRGDLPFTTLTGLVDCDTFYDIPVNFPAHWHNRNFDGVLRKGTPVAQCMPVKRESWSGHFEALSGEGANRLAKTRDAISRFDDVYRREYRMPKR